MSKLYLKYTFDTSKPEHMYEYSSIIKALKYRRFILELYEELRSKAKHRPDSGNFADAYDLFWDYMKDNNLDLRDLYEDV